MKDISVLIQSIVSSQEDIVGPLAVEQANTVSGIHVDTSGKVKISLKESDDSKRLLQNLVKKYEQLFGQASVEICRDAVRQSGLQLDDTDLPEILR